METTFTLASGKVIEMGVMTARQFIKAQDLVGNLSNSAKVAFVLAIASVKSIDGMPVMPLSNSIAFDGVADRLSVQDGLEIVEHYAQLNPQPEGDELKNSPSAEPNA